MENVADILTEIHEGYGTLSHNNTCTYCTDMNVHCEDSNAAHNSHNSLQT